MRKTFIAALVLACAVAMVESCYAQAEARAVTRPIMRGSQVVASGVMVAPGVMVTAGHVASFKGLRVGGEVVRVLYLEDTGARDIAVLQVISDCPCAALAQVLPPLDTPVVAVGFPEHPTVGTQILTRGEIQGSTFTHGARLVHTAAIAPGSSGGGLFARDAHGRWLLIGINVELVTVATYIGRSVPLGDIREALRRAGAAQ
jgi:hypothetical protein